MSKRSTASRRDSLVSCMSDVLFSVCSSIPYDTEGPIERSFKCSTHSTHYLHHGKGDRNEPSGNCHRSLFRSSEHVCGPLSGESGDYPVPGEQRPQVLQEHRSPGVQSECAHKQSVLVIGEVRLHGRVSVKVEATSLSDA